MIAALFVDTERGPYPQFDGVECWDETRDARSYAGPHPVVAHPPCARWCRLAKQLEAMHGLKVGDDGGCFETAFRAVRTYGGVLEHPAYSLAWNWFGLPKPRRGGWYGDLFGGWSCQVDQSHFGHPAQKSTWLYAFGVSWLPSLPWEPRGGRATVTQSRGKRGACEQMAHADRHLTPRPFAQLLISIALSACKS
jgi:hypothetical protein